MTDSLEDMHTKYKILVLYVLKPLCQDLRKRIYDEIVALEIIELINQNWHELTQEWYNINLDDSDIDSDDLNL